MRALKAVQVAENRSSACDSVYAADVCTVVTHDDPLSPAYGPDRSISPSPNLFSVQWGMRSKKPVLISGCLDNTIKVWDIESGKIVNAVRTYRVRGGGGGRQAQACQWEPRPDH